MKKLVSGIIVAGVLAVNPVAGHAALGDNTLKPETHDSDVQDLQALLKKKGYFTYHETTNYFGPYTESAVKKLQKEKGMNVDGVAGDSVYKALGVFSKQAIVDQAEEYRGTPYEWGGETPDGFDCSGYLNYIFDKAANIDLPRVVKDIHEEGTSVDSPHVGDIVFFDIEGNGNLSHAGVYVGDGKFMHASSSKGVTTSELDSSYWAPKYEGAKRYR
ncbi:NlpC/P60 family protein [Fictibacillus sp. WQ 8-8]|uniref:NlpC/P60 family protein n=1 Tax=Fictibacillus marinisediminis TaxID=2878389 RepID=A0A9X2BC21_9BACL|nr:MULTISPECIES: NlpC/P60 family protein [Fictibacillus]MCK6256464.1 NlpC/P60 family protein [Fictibacillus marinisediminis]MCQ6265256.1 NlpC/P60 family protein [Fictibacillus sp. WQ 8-8]MED2971933.1 NlpC/P60 family protein [Fictibacillus sp. B-59209]SFE00434.1 Cell wall-associated hydrolase, NlpC family [Bacillus sp. OV194]